MYKEIINNLIDLNEKAVINQCNDHRINDQINKVIQPQIATQHYETQSAFNCIKINHEQYWQLAAIDDERIKQLDEAKEELAQAKAEIEQLKQANTTQVSQEIAQLRTELQNCKDQLTKQNEQATTIQNLENITSKLINELKDLKETFAHHLEVLPPSPHVAKAKKVAKPPGAKSTAKPSIAVKKP